LIHFYKRDLTEIVNMNFLSSNITNLHIPSIGGIKKQISKADQLVSQQISGAEQTKLDEDFQKLEKATDVHIELQADLSDKTKEYLYPNPTVRAKMITDTGISKLGVGVPSIPGSKVGSALVQDPTRALSDSYEKGGKKMVELYGDEPCPYGESLSIAGESFNQLADLRKAMEENVTQNYLTPSQDMQNKDLSEAARLRKKVAGHKLDYDCKKRHGVQGGELNDAERKFAESYQASQLSMHSVLQNDTEYIMQVAALSSSLNDYHAGCVTVLEDLVKQLKYKRDHAMKKPRPDFQPKSLFEMTGHAPTNISRQLHLDTNTNGTSRGASPAGSPWGSPAGTPAKSPSRPPSRPPSRVTSPVQKIPSCKALYDFDSESKDELGFKEGDIIKLKTKLDENWFEGELGGKVGMFPVDYVEIIVPLP